MSYDAIVVGGGVVGASIAYQLVSAGARTLLRREQQKRSARRQHPGRQSKGQRRSSCLDVLRDLHGRAADRAGA